ncbi:MAG TPA: HAD-IA family hydrolase [Gemmatimonadales bacterium]|jgi:pyrophosphatase PpaX|nr:HAD-IA family hydrolase [Gemmatimonadales bacterium]
MSAFQTILFDLDGTLIDSVDLIVDSYHHTFRTHGLPMLTREQILAGMGTPLRIVFGNMTDDAAAITTWTATYREYNLAHHDSRVHAYPGTVDMVQRIKRAGRRVALVTSKNHAGAERGLKLVGLEGAMEAIIGADDVTHPKPHAEPVERALASLGMPAESCLFVGDSQHDVHSGRGAGVWTAGVTWGPFDRAHLEMAMPDHYCATPGELLQLIEA